MKIHVYTDIHQLFGASAMVWVHTLLAAGHDVEYIDIGMSTTAALPHVGPCDLNIIVAGIYAFERFGRLGLPAHGRHVFWLMDPLTRNSTSTHSYKAGLFDSLAPRIHAVAAIDTAMAAYLHENFQGLAVWHIPCLIAPVSIKPPPAETDRRLDVLWLGSDNPRRRHAARLFEGAGIHADFAFRQVWGAERNSLRRSARIVLNVHADDSHTYFDQFRAVETWAAGSVVVAEHSDDLAQHGVLEGVHIASAPLAQLPALCRELLGDAARREAMTAAGQALLHQAFTPQVWQTGMLGVVAQAMSADA